MKLVWRGKLRSDVVAVENSEIHSRSPTIQASKPVAVIEFQSQLQITNLYMMVHIDWDGVDIM